MTKTIERKDIDSMTPEEVVYYVAESWVDEIIEAALEHTAEWFANQYTKVIILKAANAKAHYEYHRKGALLERDDFHKGQRAYASQKWREYSDILWECFFKDITNEEGSV